MIKTKKTTTDISWDDLTAKPTGTAGQVLTYNGSTNTWVASAVPVGGSGVAPTNSFTINGSMLAKAWVTFNGKKDTSGANSTSNTNRLINASYNVDSVSRTAEGKYTINFKAGTFESANYVYTVGVESRATGVRESQAVRFGNKTITSLQIESDDDGAADTDDLSEICFTFYASGGDLTGSANVFDSTPVGTINYFASPVAPSGYLNCDGTLILRSSYPDLFTAIGTRYNTGGEPSTMFRLPDLRGEFIRGWDNGKGVDDGRVFGSWQKGSLHNIGAGPDADTVCDYNTNPGVQGRNDSGYDAIDNLSIYPNAQWTNSGIPIQSGTPTYTDNTYGATRPRNVALLPCIKAVKTVNGVTSSLNFIQIPPTASSQQVLTYNGSTNTWVASAVPTGGSSLPTGTSGQVLTYNGSTNTWVASSIAVGMVLDNTPIGTVGWFAATAPPAGYLECNGSAVLRSTYTELDAAIYIGNANNSTASFGYRCTNANSPSTSRSTTGQFIVLPDLRGEFIRGWDNGKGVDNGRVFGSWQKGTIFGHDNTATTAYGVVGVVHTGGNVSQTISLTALGLDDYNTADYPNIQLGSVFSLGDTTTLPQFAGDSGSSGTTRPRNVALLPCIKAVRTVNGTTQPLNFIEKPTNPTNGQILTYNSFTSTWVASAAPVGGSSSFPTKITASANSPQGGNNGDIWFQY